MRKPGRTSRVSSSYFFLFFEPIPIFSYFLTKTSYFSYFLAGEAKICENWKWNYSWMCFIVIFIIKQVVCWFWCPNISKSNSHICSSVRRILEQWDCICSFVKDLGKDPITTPKNVAYKRVSAMWNDEEGKKTKAQQEFVGNVSPVFEDFLTILQNSCPQVHLLYDKMSEFLRKLMGRFLKKDAYEKNLGSDLVSIDCSVNSLLPILQLERPPRRL